MGANAYRCSHNPPDPVLLELCDRYGILVMDEARKFGVGADATEELEYMIYSGRNHPSIICWSMGNEEHLQHEELGAKIMRKMADRTRQLDDRPITLAMQFGFFNDALIKQCDLIGVNYNQELYDAIHARYPDKAIIASEILSIADTICFAGSKCSGADGAFDTLQQISKRPFVGGSFGWVGQDYRGEHRALSFYTNCAPTDTIGDAKDGFYRYRAMWTNKPVVHICGNWCHKEIGTKVNVTVYSNAERVVLFLNGKMVGDTMVSPTYEASFIVLYEPGELMAIGYRGTERVGQDVLVTPSKPVKIILQPENKTSPADGRTMIRVRVYAVDEKNRVVPTARYRFRAISNKLGTVVCTDNADPYYGRFPDDRDCALYNGSAMICIRPDTCAGVMEVCVETREFPPAFCNVELTEALYEGMPLAGEMMIRDWFVSYPYPEAPDVYESPTDPNYIKFLRYGEASVIPAAERPFYFRSGYIRYCAEPDVPTIREGQTPTIVFGAVSGRANVLVTVRSFNNEITGKYFAEKNNSLTDRFEIPLPGVQEGDSLVIKLIVEGHSWDDGLLSAVWFRC